MLKLGKFKIKVYSSAHHKINGKHHTFITRVVYVKEAYGYPILCCNYFGKMRDIQYFRGELCLNVLGEIW